MKHQVKYKKDSYMTVGYSRISHIWPKTFVCSHIIFIQLIVKLYDMIAAIGSNSINNASSTTTPPPNISKNGITSQSSNNAKPPVVNQPPTVSISTSKDQGCDVGDPASMLNNLQNYLVKSPLLQSNNGDNDNTTQQIQDINQSMNNIALAMTTNNSSNVLSQQQAMQSIVDQEMKRLEYKKQNVDSAMDTQKRMMILNDSFLKRQRMFSRISIAIVIGVFLILIFRYFSLQSEELGPLANVLSVFVIVSVFIYSLWTYIAIIRRDPIYFDQIAYVPDNLTPAPTSSGGSYSPPNVQSQLISKGEQCMGSDCCSNGTVWSTVTNSCVAIGTQPTKNVS